MASYYSYTSPPPPPPPDASASYYASPLQQRRSSAQSYASTSGYASDASYASLTPPPAAMGKPLPRRRDPNARVLAVFLVPSAWIVLTDADESALGLQTALVLGLIVYSLDLAHARTAVLVCQVLSAVVLAVVGGWVAASETASIVWPILWALVGLLLWLVVAGWSMLEMEWLATTSMARQVEAAVHGLSPLLAASILAYSSTSIIEDALGRDAAGLATPVVFAGILAAGMLWVGSCESGLAPRSDNNKPLYCINPTTAGIHAAVLLLGPPLIHLATCLNRLVSRRTASDDWYDLILVTAVPYLLGAGLSYLDQTGAWPSPYSMTRVYGQSSDTLQGQFLPVVVSILASLAVQQRYLLTWSHAFAARFMNQHDPIWLSTLYWMTATLLMVTSGWLWGRKSAATQEALFGDYHEDVVQLSLAAAGMALGKAFGLPWNFTPLPILAVLGLTLWIASRMLRYLAIFLFVWHATGVVIFTYRFAGITHSMELPLPFAPTLALTRFGFVVVLCSVLIGLVAGLAVRSNGGWGNQWLKQWDVAGCLLTLYMVLLMILEITLLKRPVPTNELAGVELDTEDEADMLYDHGLAIVTSAVLIGLASFMKRVKLISARTAGVVVSLAIGKGIAMYIDADRGDDGKRVFLRSIVAAVLCIVMFAPRVFLEPVHIKTVSRRRSSLSGGADLPPTTRRVIVLYAFIFLPVALVIAVPAVLFPLAGVFAEKYQADFYTASSPMPELIGSVVSLWGLACLSTLNYYLPDGGGEAWKKLSGLVFLIGIGIFFAAPMLGGNMGEAAHNPYAAMSSLGAQLISRGRSRTGGYGLLAAALSTLLALSGPLELKERRNVVGKKDKLLMFRTMVFSLLFGGGVAWFIVMQSMREAEFVSLVFVTLGCLISAFVGTIAGVLGHFLDLEEYGDAVQVVQVWMFLSAVIVPFCWFSQMLVKERLHWFGPSGWLSTCLAVVSATALAISFSIHSRKTKNATTSGLTNLAAVISWSCAVAVLHGRFGVAGLDANYEVQTLFWLPISVIGTLLVSPILLLLEGEASHRRSSTKRLSATSVQTTGGFGLHLAQLRRSNRWVPLIFGSVAVLLLASLYAIFLRGSGLFSMFGGPTVSSSHEQVYDAVFGDSNEQDLATLVKKTMTHGSALAASAKIAGSGFWTARSPLGPLLHLAGVASTLPSLYFLFRRSWWRKSVPTAQVTLALPLNAIPILLCRGIPSLQVTAVIGLVGGLFQASSLRQADHESMMSI